MISVIFIFATNQERSYLFCCIYHFITISMNQTDTPNAFELLAQVKLNMKLAWMSKQEVNQKFNELHNKATAGDYENLVDLCSEWLDVEAIKEELEEN